MHATDRLSFRRIRPDDLLAIRRWKNDCEVKRSLVGFSVSFTAEDIEEWYERDRHSTEDSRWIIVAKDGEIPVGFVGLYRIDRYNGKAGLGILIGEKMHWNRGLATEATSAVLAYAFRELNLHRVELEVLSTNKAALRVYEKCGFLREGALREAIFRDDRHVDLVIMGILRSQWKVDNRCERP